MSDANPLEITGLILFAVSWLLLAFSMYAFRFFPVLKKESPEKSAQNRVAVVICAHNEESVIADLLTALQKQTRPADKVYVIADNCSDDTAAIAGRMGAVVFEKKTTGGGKADALRFAFEKLQHEEFDGLVFLDADVILQPDFLVSISKDLEKVELVIARREFADPHASWSEAGNALSAHAMWYLYFLPRYQSGVLSLVLGTAYAVRRAFLEKLQWEPRTLTEDLAFTVDAAIANATFTLCPQAVFQDQQPDTWLVSWHRMRRWMTGDLQCLRHYFMPLAKQITQGKLMYADLLLYLMSVPLLAVKAVGTLFLIAAAFSGCWKILACVVTLELLTAICSGMVKFGRFPLRYFSIPAYFFLLLQLPWIALSVCIKPSKRWIPGRSVSGIREKCQGDSA